MNLSNPINPGPVKEYVKRDDEQTTDPYRGRRVVIQVLDAIYTLAHSFCKRGNIIENMMDFIRAYIFEGIVTEKREGPSTNDENIYTRMFREMHLASNR